jgi:protein phosphatase
VGSGKSLDYCDLTDVGRRRSNNQDAKAVLDAWSPEQYRTRGWLFLVADGMGAHAAGEMASAIAAKSVPLIYEKLASRSPPLALRSSIQQANEEIHARGESAFDLRGMGTTCTTLVIGQRGVLVGHVGDSRAYRVRANRIEQLTSDHSLAWEVEAQRAKSGDASSEHSPSVPKNIITRSLGPHARVDVDLEGPFPVSEGDVYVVCSDGLSGQVADEEIGALVTELPPADAAAALVGLTLVRGAPDNVTLVVARAGPKEKTAANANATPWPLTESKAAQGTPSLPLGPLTVAAGGLLGALLFNPAALLGEQGLLGGWLFGAMASPLGWALTGLMVLLCVSGIVASIVALMPSASDEMLVLRPGARLGKGPYRAYDCGLSNTIVDGIVASVETAADGLSDTERRQALDRVTAARQAMARGDLTAALADAAAAIAVYRKSVVSARNDDTLRTDGTA